MKPESVRMSPDQVAMLVGGIALFVVALGLLVYLVSKKRPIKTVFALFPIAIVMIGFSRFQSFKLPGFEADFTASFREFKENPDSAGARSNLDQVLDTRLARNGRESLTPEAHSNLVAATAELSRRPNLSPQARLTLSKAQLALGRTNEAAGTLNSVVKLHTNLVVDPRMRYLLKPFPH